MLFAVALAQSLAGDIVVRDAFDRDVRQRGVVLLDWEGHMANPAVKLKVQLPAGITGPATLYLHGTDSRIHFDRSAPDDRTGIGKRVDVTDATKAVEIFTSMFPDRDGRDEKHELVLQVFVAGREAKRTHVPISVIDQDVPGRKGGGYPITVDFSEDRTGWTRSKDVRRVVDLAAQDWAYFMMDIGQDTVPAGAERIPIWNKDGFKTQREIKNPRPYRGYLMYVTGIHHEELRAGGAPSLISEAQTAKGKPTTLRRSGTVEFEITGNWNSLGWLLTQGDHDWWYSGGLRNEQSDLYSIAIHEMGHALCFHPHYPVYGAAKKTTFNDPRLVRYLGFAPKVDDSDHLPGVIDPVSLYGGYGMEFLGKMKSRRWLITKSHLICLQAIGYRVRQTEAFHELETPTALEIRGGTSARIPASGGVPTYHFKVSGGSLPSGVTLDSYSGELRGLMTNSQFTVEVDDQDPTTPPRTTKVTTLPG